MKKQFAEVVKNTKPNPVAKGAAAIRPQARATLPDANPVKKQKYFAIQEPNYLM